MPNRRPHILLILILILTPIALLLIGLPSLWLFMRSTATTLHPDPHFIPSKQALLNPPDQPAATTARALTRAALTRQNLPALSIAVARRNQLVWAEAFGYADLDDNIPATPQHRFPLGTASTLLTSAAAGLLIEQGRLQLDAPIQTYVPELPADPWPITLRQIMAHTAGLPTDAGDESPLFARHCSQPTDALTEFGRPNLRSEPGVKFRYSRFGWIVVTAAIEAAAKRPFLDFLRDHVLTPAGLDATLPHPGPEIPIPNAATPYFPRFSADPTYGLHLLRPLDFSCYTGASGLLTTPSDLVRFALAFQSGKLLQPATVALLQSSQRLPDGKPTGYGLGWDLETITIHNRPTPTTGHDGDILGGPVASLLTVPTHGITVAVMSNISYADTFALASQIAAAFAPPAN